MTEAAATDESVREQIASFPRWYHRIEIRPGIVTPGVTDCATTLRNLSPPADCRGLRVLDIGTRDGFFAFEFERRGAEVIAIDYVSKDYSGFGIAADLIGSHVTYVQENIYHVSPERYGTFDIVLCLGLLYHLRDPLLALDIIRRVCTKRLYLETQAIDNALLLPDGSFEPLNRVAPRLSTVPIMQFYPRASLNNDPTNYWAPNLACLVAMLEESMFTVERSVLLGHRAIVQCGVATEQDIAYQARIARGVVGDP